MITEASLQAGEIIERITEFDLTLKSYKDYDKFYALYREVGYYLFSEAFQAGRVGSGEYLPEDDYKMFLARDVVSDKVYCMFAVIDKVRARYEIYGALDLKQNCGTINRTTRVDLQYQLRPSDLKEMLSFGTEITFGDSLREKIIIL